MTARKPTAADMVEHVGTVEQRLPRRKPSLPAIGMEGVNKGRASLPLAIPERRHIVEEMVEHVGAGRDRTREPQRRAQTLAEQLYDGGFIDHDEVTTARTVRDLYHSVVSTSEGVASYGDPRGSGAPWDKAARKAGEIERQRSDRRNLACLMYAMCGIRAKSGLADFDRQLFEILQRACVATVDRPTLAMIGAARSEYGSERQRSAAGTTVLREALRKGAIYLGLIRAEPWLEEASLRITGDVVK